MFHIRNCYTIFHHYCELVGGRSPWNYMLSRVALFLGSARGVDTPLLLGHPYFRIGNSWSS